MMTSRRRFLFLSAAAVTPSTLTRAGIDHLPLHVAFKGTERFSRIAAQAVREEWSRLPIGARVARCGRALLGVPYVGFTLEIDDRTECPSANCNGLDCWTFFEIALGMARMLERPRGVYTPHDLLREIEWTRYRAGRCSGNYLERIHYLNEWFIDNEARGNVQDISKRLGGVPLRGRNSREMTALWRSYRYLRNNPSLRPRMAQIEAAVSALPVYYIPKGKVASIEGKLADGDIAGIVTKYQGGVCSHVGLITKDEKGRSMFLHASRNYRKVTIEGTISSYLNKYGSHAGVIIARPLPVKNEVRDTATYRSNLRRLGAA